MIKKASDKMKLFDELKNKFGEKKDIPVIQCMHCGKEFITYDDLSVHIPNCKFRKEAYKMISNFGDEVLSDVKKEEKIIRRQITHSQMKRKKIKRKINKKNKKHISSEASKRNVRRKVKRNVRKKIKRKSKSNKKLKMR